MPDNIMLENESVDAKRQMAVYQRFEQGGRSVLCAIVFCTSHSLNRIFIIDMGSAYGTEHIVGMIGTRDRRTRNLNILFFCQTGEGLEELLLYQFLDGETDIILYLFVSGSRLQRNTCHDRKIRDEIIAAAHLEFFGKLTAPVLAAPLSRVDIQIRHHIAMRTVQ